MRPSPILTLTVAASTLIWLSACGEAEKPAPRRLSDKESVMTVRTDAPESRMTVADPNAAVADAGPTSQFGPAAGQASVFRAAEVPQEKLAETQALLSELGARETPDRAIRFDLPADILFDFDKADLRADAAPALDKAARLIAAYSTAPITVAGHTDAKGDDAYNNALSMRRAQSVAAWLKNRTSREARTEGMGERQPVAPNVRPDGGDDPQGRQRNRRVEITLAPPPS